MYIFALCIYVYVYIHIIYSHLENSGAALKVYESVEAWDALVVCYRLLEKTQLADQLIRRRLQV